MFIHTHCDSRYSVETIPDGETHTYNILCVCEGLKIRTNNTFNDHPSQIIIHTKRQTRGIKFPPQIKSQLHRVDLFSLMDSLTAS